jgi:hypothetical protein
MKVAHHALELIDAPPDQIRDAIRKWLSDAGFKVRSSPSDLHVIAERGSGLGLSDRQTARIMEIIIKGSGEVTAVSIYHHTGRFGPIAGLMFGGILDDEVNSLWTFLRNAIITNR